MTDGVSCIPIRYRIANANGVWPRQNADDIFLDFGYLASKRRARMTLAGTSRCLKVSFNARSAAATNFVARGSVNRALEKEVQRTPASVTAERFGIVSKITAFGNDHREGYLHPRVTPEFSKRHDAARFSDSLFQCPPDSALDGVYLRRF